MMDILHFTGRELGFMRGRLSLRTESLIGESTQHVHPRAAEVESCVAMCRRRLALKQTIGKSRPAMHLEAVAVVF